MKIKIILFFSIFLFSCTKKESKPISNSQGIDSVSYYYKLSQSSEITNEEKNLFLLDALRNFTFLNNTEQNRTKLAEITFDFYRINKFEELNKSSDFLLKKSLLAKDSVNIGKALRCKAIYFKERKNLDSSLIYYLKAEKIYKKLNDPLTLGNVYFNKGIVQYDGDDFLGAELSLSRANNIFKNSEKKDKLFGVLNQLAIVYTDLKDYEKAISYLNEALKLVKDYNLENQEHQTSVCLSNIGFIYQIQEKYNQAIDYYKNALSEKDLKSDTPELYSNILDNLSFCNIQLGNYDDDTYKLLIESLEIRLSLGYKSATVLSYNHISEYYLKKGDLKSALIFANLALKLSKETNIPLDYLSALKQLSKTDESYIHIYSKEYIRISDSIQVEERKSKDRFSRIQLETDEIILEKDLLEDKNRNLLYIFFGSVALFMFLYYLRTQRAKNRELLYKQAQQKANEDIFNLMMSQQAVIDESRTNEKQKLARELHDGVLGRMFGLRLSLDSVNRLNDEQALMKRNQIIQELKTIEQDIREISHDLNREKQVLINNFVSIVDNLIEEQKEKHDAKISFFLDNSIHWDKVASAVKINLYRILQESLQNINKYAKAKNINVGFVKNDNAIIFKINDDGVGFNVNKKAKGIGTQNMIARTKECKGTIDIHSEIGEGTTITISIPIITENKP